MPIASQGRIASANPSRSSTRAAAKKLGCSALPAIRYPPRFFTRNKPNKAGLLLSVAPEEKTITSFFASMDAASALRLSCRIFLALYDMLYKDEEFAYKSQKTAFVASGIASNGENWLGHPN